MFRHSNAYMLAAFLTFSSTAALSGTEVTSQFSKLWGDYLTVCGAIVDDPESAFSTANPLANGRISTWAVSKEGSSVHGSISLPDYSREASFHVRRVGEAYSVFCEAHIFSGDAFDVFEAANSIRQILTEEGEIAVVGGEIRDVPGASATISETDQAPWISLSTNEVFSEKHLITSVDVQPGSLAITLFGFLE